MLDIVSKLELRFKFGPAGRVVNSGTGAKLVVEVVDKSEEFEELAKSLVVVGEGSDDVVGSAELVELADVRSAELEDVLRSVEVVELEAEGSAELAEVDVVKGSAELKEVAATLLEVAEELEELEELDKLEAMLPDVEDDETEDVTCAGAILEEVVLVELEEPTVVEEEDRLAETLLLEERKVDDAEELLVLLDCVVMVERVDVDKVRIGVNEGVVVETRLADEERHELETAALHVPNFPEHPFPQYAFVDPLKGS